MGWTTMERPASVRNYFENQLTWDTEEKSNRCIDVAMKLNVLFAAVETTKKATGAKEVWCAVVLLRYYKNPSDGYDFGHKDLTEHMMPGQSDCPKRILDLLTPTENNNANEWRAACRARLARVCKEGDTIVFRNPVKFKDGFEGRRFKVVMTPGRRRRKKALRGENGGIYRVTGLASRDDWVVVVGTETQGNCTETPDWVNAMANETSVSF